MSCELFLVLLVFHRFSVEIVHELTATERCEPSSPTGAWEPVPEAVRANTILFIKIFC